MDSKSEDEAPMVSMNKAGWRAVTLASSVLSLALIAGLLAQDGLFSSVPGRNDHPDGLTTLALVLAILAFLVQLFIFVLQTNASNAAVRRSEELNRQTHGVLGKIEAESTTTKEVLITQFNSLLDFVVGGGGPPARTAEGQSPDEPRGADVQETVVAEEADSPVTASQLQRILLENLRPRERPTLEAAPRTSPGPEDRMIIDYLQDWPTKEEAEAAIGELKQLPPFCLALLTRYGITEVEQRMQGESVGLLTREPKLGITERLLEEGLLKPHGDRLALTERGRELARVLPVGKKTAEPPSWFDETLKATAVG